MDYISILLEDEDEGEDEGNVFKPTTSSDIILERLDNLAAARKASRLASLLELMLERGTLRLDSELLPAYMVDAVKRQQANTANTKAFAVWLNTFCDILIKNKSDYRTLYTTAIECQTYADFGSVESGKAYQLCRKRLSWYRKALKDVSHDSPLGTYYTMCANVLHGALNARLNETLKNAKIISERAYKGAKCKYHTDISGQAKSDYKRVIHNTGVNAQAYDHMPTDAPIPARQPPKIIRKLSKIR